jgi:large subunit ribosomal protein L25
MKISELKANVRNLSGKGPSRRLRIESSIPAVFYGPKSESIRLAVNATELMKLLKDKEENVFIKLLIGDENKVEKLSMIKEIQTDPLTKRFLHVDFYEIRLDQKITFDIPIHFAGEPIGLDHGGELHHLKREVKVSCLPGKLPDFIEVDVKNLDIGDTIAIKDIKFDGDIIVLDSKDVVIAAVSAVKIIREAETPEGAEGAESVGENAEIKEE